jgi:hypothetical protein
VLQSHLLPECDTGIEIEFHFGISSVQKRNVSVINLIAGRWRIDPFLLRDVFFKMSFCSVPEMLRTYAPCFRLWRGKTQRSSKQAH